MIVGVIRLEARIAGTRSLKEKRALVQSVLAKARNRLRLSAAEVEDHDLINRVVFGVATVGSDRIRVHQALDAFEELVAHEPAFTYADAFREVGPFPVELVEGA